MKIRILIVEDEDLIRDLMKMILEGAYDLEEAPTAAALREKFQCLSAPDLVILDLSLPDGNGLELLPEIRAKWPASRVMILTGQGTVEAAEQAYHLDGVSFQSKPFDVGALRNMVSLALSNPAQPDAPARGSMGEHAEPSTLIHPSILEEERRRLPSRQSPPDLRF